MIVEIQSSRLREKLSTAPQNTAGLIVNKQECNPTTTMTTTQVVILVLDNFPYGATTFSLTFTKRDISLRLIRYYII